ncbi:cell division protein FtsQ/DivIB [Lutimaribacter sp. EGI FJ00015]|uniref:Cell division protein FtsQ/DivIB n=1 Tax=Lutimaribacter degradans TaxID=2945989 RepID=A0ACC5ZS67_9RHOB|nr:cell division protein FtsQ/DivIB [Lutimaribacter sp. EGI FJ00013]MCM2560690.1 cell division protein FtsQ/DivIB [Lutimaribacter sp. EGI FJ00013]MCO0612366.1 cell division protein FtsQ/DivIB [Lutimaribacter sp. EGI FJ00015]MCO0634514.1 cell division protein FtsQ/DivIB [Lutimaribacter sp. EGI FJ00014]
MQSLIRRKPEATATARPDPAPSRLRYRMQRLMLTPEFRLFLRLGVPMALTFAIASLWLSDEARRDQLSMAIADIRTEIETRPEFMVNVMAVDGASAGVDEDIREILPLDFPVSSFDLELASILATVRELPAVKDAAVRIRNGGVLQIDVTERVPAALWRSRDGLELVDETGAVLGVATARADHPELPVIAGDGAAEHVAEALRVIRATGPLAPRLRGLVRMGERRWDVVLDRDQRILLPEDKPVQALERVIALDHAQELLERDVAAVDMRLTGRPTVRMKPSAIEQWRKVQKVSLGE